MKFIKKYAVLSAITLLAVTSSGQMVFAEKTNSEVVEVVESTDLQSILKM